MKRELIRRLEELEATHSEVSPPMLQRAFQRLSESTGIASLGFDRPFATDDVGASGEAIRILPNQGTVQRGRTFAEASGVIAHEYGHPRRGGDPWGGRDPAGDLQVSLTPELLVDGSDIVEVEGLVFTASDTVLLARVPLESGGWSGIWRGVEASRRSHLRVHCLWRRKTADRRRHSRELALASTHRLPGTRE